MVQEQIEIHPESENGDNDAIAHLKHALACGKPWHIALLEAIGMWTLPEETCNGRHYRYLIDGEAFDWLLLAERLCRETNGSIPENELQDLLFFGSLPVCEDDFKRLIGNVKYQAYLNFLYGVTVESFLVLAVEEEIQKERRAMIFHKDEGPRPDSYRRIYGDAQDSLLKRFRQQKGYPQAGSITIDELHEFTYWLFKYRLQKCDKERVASDTKKGLDYMKRQRMARGFASTRAGEDDDNSYISERGGRR